MNAFQESKGSQAVVNSIRGDKSGRYAQSRILQRLSNSHSTQVGILWSRTIALLLSWIMRRRAKTRQPRRLSREYFLGSPNHSPFSHALVEKRLLKHDRQLESFHKPTAHIVCCTKRAWILFECFKYALNCCLHLSFSAIGSSVSLLADFARPRFSFSDAK